MYSLTWNQACNWNINFLAPKCVLKYRGIKMAVLVKSIHAVIIKQPNNNMHSQMCYVTKLCNYLFSGLMQLIYTISSDVTLLNVNTE